MFDVSDAVLACSNRTAPTASNTTTTTATTDPAQWPYTAKQLTAIKQTVVPMLLQSLNIEADPQHRELRRLLAEAAEQIQQHPAVRKLQDLKRCLADAEQHHQTALHSLEHTKRTAQDRLSHAVTNPNFTADERTEVRQQVHAAVREAQQAADDAFTELEIVRGAIDEARPAAVAVYETLARQAIQQAQKAVIGAFDSGEVLALICSRELHDALQRAIDATTLIDQLRTATEQVPLVNRGEPGEANDAVFMRELTSGRGSTFAILSEMLPKL